MCVQDSEMETMGLCDQNNNSSSNSNNSKNWDFPSNFRHAQIENWDTTSPPSTYDSTGLGNSFPVRITSLIFLSPTFLLVRVFWFLFS